MIKAKLIRQNDGTTARLMRKIKTACQKSIEVGHFMDQGDHSDIDLSYVDLLTIWSMGVAKNNEGIIRDPKLAFIESELTTGKITQKAAYKRAKKHFISKISESAAVGTQTLNMIGELFEKEYKKVFNAIGPHMPPDSDGTPMYETGELEDKVTHRINKR